MGERVAISPAPAAMRWPSTEVFPVPKSAGNFTVKLTWFILECMCLDWRDLWVCHPFFTCIAGVERVTGAACLQSLRPGLMKGVNNNNKSLQTKNNQGKAKHGYMGMGEALLELRPATPRGCRPPCLTCSSSAPQALTS